MKALVFERFGGPEVLAYVDVPDPPEETGHVVVRTAAIGLNFADVYRRNGVYHLAGAPPYILGYEAAGTIESVGPGCENHQPGDRVAFADSPFANAERVSVAVGKLIPLPADISFETAAATLLQGLTAHYLVTDSYALRAGESVLVHAAAGGVGLLLVQVARSLGARVLALTSSEIKGAVAVRAGAECALRYDDDWVAAARAFGKSGGVDVAYDSVGSTLDSSLQAIRTGGHVVFFGMAGGDPKAVDPRVLMDGSKTLSGGGLWNVLTSPTERERRAKVVFAWLRDGSVRVEVGARFPLYEGQKAHHLIESRKSVGKILLIP